MTHTPGPWNYEWVYTLLRYSRKQVGPWDEIDGNHPDADDSHLIASAPDLLAFIKKPYPIEAYDKWREAGDAASAEALDMYEDERRALIAKAEGND